MASDTSALRREVERALPDRPFAIELWDGTAVPATREGPTLTIHSPRAIGHFLRAPGELGLGRAYVCGEIDVDDLDGIISLLGRWHPPPLGLGGAASLRRGGPARVRPLASAVAPCRRAAARRSPAHEEPRRRGRPPSLRRLQRVLRPLPRRDDDLQLRAVRGGGRDARGRPARQARADLPQSSSSSPGCGCSTSDAGGEAWRSTRRASTARARSASPSRSGRLSWPASARTRQASAIGSRSR